MSRTLRGASVLVSAALLGAMLSAGQPASATVAVRQKFFGTTNVDPVTGAVRSDRVILSWFGVTNFAAAVAGHVVLLDAWVPRGEYSGYVPTSPAELIALEPSHIFIGHGHFDHAADAADIAARSKATLVGTPEHCDQMRAQAGMQLACIAAVPRGAAPGATNSLDVLLGVEITAVKHVHSAGRRPDASDPHAPVAPPPDVQAVLEHPPAPHDSLHLATHLADGEGGTVLYQFRVGDFALLWHDSTGPLKDDAPAVLDVLRGLPPTDVQVGAVMGFNQLTNGLRDQRMYIEALTPKEFVPSHHDNWAPPISTRAENYRPAIEEEIRRIPPEQRPVLRFIRDPQDFVNPAALTFVPSDPVWATAR